MKNQHLEKILAMPNKYNIDSVVWGTFSDLHKSLKVLDDGSIQTNEKMKYIHDHYSELKSPIKKNKYS